MEGMRRKVKEGRKAKKGRTANESEGIKVK
jgi:hypothetical protein